MLNKEEIGYINKKGEYINKRSFDKGYQQAKQDFIKGLSSFKLKFCYCSDFNPKCKYCDVIETFETMLKLNSKGRHK